MILPELGAGSAADLRGNCDVAETVGRFAVRQVRSPQQNSMPHLTLRWGCSASEASVISPRVCVRVQACGV
jgi:hypothetical protein